MVIVTYPGPTMEKSEDNYCSGGFPPIKIFSVRAGRGGGGDTWLHGLLCFRNSLALDAAGPSASLPQAAPHPAPIPSASPLLFLCTQPQFFPNPRGGRPLPRTICLWTKKFPMLRVILEAASYLASCWRPNPPNHPPTNWPPRSHPPARPVSPSLQPPVPTTTTATRN